MTDEEIKIIRDAIWNLPWAWDVLDRLVGEFSAALARAEAAEARCATLEAERDDLLHAFQEIWDDWCSGHMGDCNCVVCSLTADALNIDRAALAAEEERT